MAKYTEADRGKFDAWLLRDGVAVAYTDHDSVKITQDFRQGDRKAVMEFADSYELPLDIEFWA